MPPVHTTRSLPYTTALLRSVFSCSPSGVIIYYIHPNFTLKIEKSGDEVHAINELKYRDMFSAKVLHLLMNQEGMYSSLRTVVLEFKPCHSPDGFVTLAN